MIVFGLVAGTFLAMVVVAVLAGATVSAAVSRAANTVTGLVKTAFNPLNWFRVIWANLKFLGRIFTQGPSRAFFNWKTDVLIIWQNSVGAGSSGGGNFYAPGS